MYYKIKSLAEKGIKITLHYFDYKQERNAFGLEEYCHEMIAYKRKVRIAGLAFNKPYIVSSRVNKQLIQNLNRDLHPILFEGFHTTGVIPYLQTKSRQLIIRVHNDEAIYYNSLALSEKNWLRRAYYLIESKLLENYQRKLPQFCTYAFLSETDRELLDQKCHFKRSHFIPGFLPWQSIRSIAGVGTYGLYNGNLSVAENKKAVFWLIENVFSKVDYPFIIAGKNPPGELEKLVDKYAHISIIGNPSKMRMEELVRNAQIHVLPSWNHTGVKLKLLNVLFNGRFCITNMAGVQGSGLEGACLIAETADEYVQMINALKLLPFTQKETALRQELLQLYNNEINALMILKLLDDADVV